MRAKIRIAPLNTHPNQVIYACNVADGDLAEGNDMVKAVRDFAEKEGARVVVVSAQVESELVALDEDDKREFLESLGAYTCCQECPFCAGGVVDRSARLSSYRFCCC